jgi:hypothetical protein
LRQCPVEIRNPADRGNRRSRQGGLQLALKGALFHGYVQKN